MKNYVKKSIGMLLFCIPSLVFANNVEKETAILSSIYDNVIVKDTRNAKQSCDLFLTDLTKNQSQDRYQQDFKRLILNWKKVEANYIAADMNADLIDLPTYLDIFHLGNEEISKSILRLLEGNQDPQIALFKNSYKSFTALETVLYTKGEWTERRTQFANIMVDTICERLSEIDEFYTTNKAQFIKDPNNAIKMLIDVMADRVFKLKDWRLGDPAGVTSKYKGNPEPMRAEYPLSQLSIEAAKAIIDAQQSLIGKQKFDNFATLLRLRGLDKGVTTAQHHLTKISNQLAKLNNFNAQDIKPIMLDLAHLYFTYYTTILEQLPIEGKILEADGD
ncbi:imelysin family protein [Pasteurella atlantica]|uniref:imelysin family protein n=1 Tax=Pasteurellaceae TaxID=712 RepID=UPI0027713A1D|nr:imelysin family protein [Pasteurella atlantica]MDP8034503.1 imelysin family protein [Pasteurella atlantica]MDP8036435.1 imelysin family protein [Pasteurella atlantica]MDP8038388.1 imelysin family protein [Pasteurella atlantica]MDP8048700.1 imelysin family protein [Pasteurella atlantica]MDP8050645.1 imelysin family protein [Pasteurella atlantica]